MSEQFLPAFPIDFNSNLGITWNQKVVGIRCVSISSATGREELGQGIVV